MSKFLVALCDLKFLCRKAAASVLAVDERQSLETLSREHKTISRTLGQLKEKQTGLEENRETRLADAQVQNARKTEVRSSDTTWFAYKPFTPAGRHDCRLTG
jgi:hypothetical protein